MDKKQGIIDLWRTSFEDTEAFINLFFSRIYKEENALTIEQNGKVVSALHVLPYTLIWHGKELPVSYIYAACTAPEMRGQGRMRQLIEEAFDVMKSRGDALTVILPATPQLFAYYRTMGYVDAFFYTEEKRFPRTDFFTPMTIVPADQLPTASLYAFFNEALKKRPCSILHTYENFQVLLQDAAESEAPVYVALSPAQEPVGLAFLAGDQIGGGQSQSKNVYIKEWVATDADTKEGLMQGILREQKAHQAIFRSPAANGTPAGMARVLDTDRICQLLADKEKSICQSTSTDALSLTDLFLNQTDNQAIMSLMFD